MTFWTSTRTSDPVTWRAVVPRARVAVNLERPILVLIALLYVVVLIVLYLYVLGETAAIKAATLQMEVELARLEEDIALRTQEAVLPIEEIAAVSETLPEEVPVIIDTAAPSPPSRVGDTAVTKEEQQTYWRAWLTRFGVSISP